MKYTFFLVAISMLFACNVKQPNKNNVVISYGTSFGMCMGYCKKQIKVNSSTIIYTASKNQPDTTSVSCNKVPDAQLMETLQKSIDTTKFAALPTVIGCPDCADGGKEWLEIESNGKKQRVEFEYGNAPTELKAIVNHLKPILDSFKEDC